MLTGQMARMQTRVTAGLARKVNFACQAFRLDGLLPVRLVATFFTIAFRPVDQATQLHHTMVQ